MEDRWTILSVIQWTSNYFASKGIPQSRANAEVLLAHVLNRDRIGLYLNYDQPLSANELARFREAVRRRAGREPTQYITGRQEFWSLEFEVTPAVLIPRPETEVLVEKALEWIGSHPGIHRVLDLGTGSGAIAVVLAREQATIELIATDRSLEAIEVARRNARRHGVADRIGMVAMDLLSAFHSASRPFDLIVSNPPYVGDDEWAQLAPEVARFEPGHALRGGGGDGLDTIFGILQNASAYLTAAGSLLLEIGQGQSQRLAAAVARTGDLECAAIHRDYAGIERAVHIRKK